jgi:hypothetical protein
METLASLGDTIVGGLIALAGVLGTLWHTSRQQRIERKYSERRDIFLAAAEATAQASFALGAFANPDLPLSELTKLTQSHPGWMNKVNIIASVATVERLQAANEFFAGRALVLMEDRFRVGDFDRRIADLRRELENIHQFQRQGATILQSLPAPAQGPPIPPRLEALLAQLQAAHTRAQQIDGQLTALFQERQLLHRKLIENSVQAILEFQETLTEANLAIRRELSVPTDDASYRSALTAGGRRLQDQFRALLDRLDSES